MNKSTCIRNINNEHKQKKKMLINIQVTTRAEKQILLLFNKNKIKKGIKIQIKKSGCAGFKCILTVAHHIRSSDLIVKKKKITFIVPKKWILVLNNTIIDFLTTGLNSSFTFKNKNYTSTCGCGESFNIQNIET